MTDFAFGDDESLLVRFGYHVNNSKGRVWPGGNLVPNAFGLFDMHGNVWEWCNDWYDVYDTTALDDPRGSAEGSGRVFRGGGWYVAAAGCRCPRSASSASAWPRVRLVSERSRVGP
jgi:formylglycine-generating enzyme required for sulfatase activity